MFWMPYRVNGFLLDCTDGFLRSLVASPDSRLEGKKRIAVLLSRRDQISLRIQRKLIGCCFTVAPQALVFTRVPKAAGSVRMV